MTIAYFPQPYFAYFLYGSGGATGPGNGNSTNWMLAMLEQIATALADTFDQDDVRIVLDPNDFLSDDPVIGTKIEIGVRALDSIPVSDPVAKDFLLIMKTEIRIRLRIWNDDLEELTLATSKVYRTLLGNDFGSTAIDSRSRIAEYRSIHASESIYELRYVLETQNLIDQVA